MKRPKRVKPKQWKLHLRVAEMNKKIIKERAKNSMYIMDDLDSALFNVGEYKHNKKASL